MENQKGHNNKKTKTIILSICALLAVGIGVFLTYSYLNSVSNEVKNTFTVGGDISLKLDETLMCGVNGRQQASKNAQGSLVPDGTECSADICPPTNTNAMRGSGNVYKLLPDYVYLKDPQVHIKTTETPAYLFIRIKVD